MPITSFLFCIPGGRRGNITLGHVQGFTTGTDDEPVLGFALQPSIQFVDCDGFVPTANTCFNCLKIPLASIHRPMPSKEFLSIYMTMHLQIPTMVCYRLFI